MFALSDCQLQPDPARGDIRKDLFQIVAVHFSLVGDQPCLILFEVFEKVAGGRYEHLLIPVFTVPLLYLCGDFILGNRPSAAAGHQNVWRGGELNQMGIALFPIVEFQTSPVTEWHPVA